MADCCEEKGCALEQLRERQSGTLKTVLWINALMFVVVLAAGLYASSSALLADKGALILAAALFVIGQMVYKLLHPGVPLFETMGAVGMLALAANGACLALLWKHREEDVNMASVWECSRNDIAANVAVLVAAGVWLFSSGWPDIVVGSLLAVLFLRSALRVIRASFRALDDANAQTS